MPSALRPGIHVKSVFEGSVSGAAAAIPEERRNVTIVFFITGVILLFQNRLHRSLPLLRNEKDAVATRRGYSTALTMLMQVQIAQGLEMRAVRIAAARGIVFIFFSRILVINTSTNISIVNTDLLFLWGSLGKGASRVSPKALKRRKPPGGLAAGTSFSLSSNAGWYRGKKLYVNFCRLSCRTGIHKDAVGGRTIEKRGSLRLDWNCHKMQRML